VSGYGFCRVARLMSYAMLRQSLHTGGVWSIARGLARNVESYKAYLNNCDLPKRNDLDGRGTLSEEGLAELQKFFLNICIDQVKFMEELMQPRKLRARAKVWCDEEIASGDLPARVIACIEDQSTTWDNVSFRRKRIHNPKSARTLLKNAWHGLLRTLVQE
jgi:hypothetical protein